MISNYFVKPNPKIRDKYNDRSSSRGEVHERGEEFGRGSKGNIRGDRQEKGDLVTEMIGGNHQGGNG